MFDYEFTFLRTELNTNYKLNLRYKAMENDATIFQVQRACLQNKFEESMMIDHYSKSCLLGLMRKTHTQKLIT